MTQARQKLENLYISIIIPAYKAQGLIAESIEGVKKVLDKVQKPYEIICVVDGKVDRTFEEATAVAKNYPYLIKVVGYEKNRGKGYAVRYGMSKAKGDVIGFIDAGGEINPMSLVNLLEEFNKRRADIIAGSKWHRDSEIIYPFYRRVISLGYLKFVRLLFQVRLNDTQAGVKIFKREIIEKLLPRLTIEGFAFDIEMLSVARFLGFNKIYETPIKVKKSKSKETTISATNIIFPVIKMFWDTLCIFYRLIFQNYYDDRNSDNWIAPQSLTIKD